MSCRSARLISRSSTSTARALSAISLVWIARSSTLVCTTSSSSARPWPGCGETRRIGLNDGDLYAQIAAPLYVTVPVWSRATIGLAYAAALIAARRYDDTVSLLDDPIVTADTQAAQWHQFITACLFHQTRRWPDVRSATAVCPPANATYVLDQVSIAVASMSAAAAASLGQFQEALELTDRLSPDNPYVAADVALTRGWCQRELGDEEGARASFRAAVVEGALLEPARQALDSANFRLIVTDADTIATRTDPWDPATEVSRSARDAAALALEQADVLARAQARLDELIGLEGPKEQIAVWRTEIQIDQLLAAQGEETSSTNENHMVLEGPPGTAKTSFARIVAEILFGLCTIQRPAPTSVSRCFKGWASSRRNDAAREACWGARTSTRCRGARVNSCYRG